MARNRERNAQLRTELDELAVVVFDGLGRGPDPSWQPEESFLVLGVSRAAASELGSRWGQNAVVWGTRGREAELLDCRTH